MIYARIPVILFLQWTNISLVKEDREGEKISHVIEWKKFHCKFASGNFAFTSQKVANYLFLMLPLLFSVTRKCMEV